MIDLLSFDWFDNILSSFSYSLIHDQNYLVFFQSKDLVCLDDPNTLPLALASWKSWNLSPIFATFCKYVISTQNTLVFKLNLFLPVYNFQKHISNYFISIRRHLRCLVINGHKFPEYFIYNDISLDQQFMVEMKALLRKPSEIMLSYVANSLFLSSYWLLEYHMSDIDCALYDTSRMLPLHN